MPCELHLTACIPSYESKCHLLLQIFLLVHGGYWLWFAALPSDSDRGIVIVNRYYTAVYFIHINKLYLGQQGASVQAPGHVGTTDVEVYTVNVTCGLWSEM